MGTCLSQQAVCQLGVCWVHVSHVAVLLACPALHVVCRSASGLAQEFNT